MIQVPLILLVICAAFFDLRAQRIPNGLCLAGLILGMGGNLFLFGGVGLRASLAGAGLALAIYFPLFLVRGMGAGDVKLMTAIGAMAGPANWLGIFVLTSVFGGMIALVRIVGKRRIAQTLSNLRLIVTSWRYRQAPYALREDLDVNSGKGLRLPHAVPIACGTASFLLAAAAWA
jgi:prepilin peptidase CpaA